MTAIFHHIRYLLPTIDPTYFWMHLINENAVSHSNYIKCLKYCDKALFMTPLLIFMHNVCNNIYTGYFLKTSHYHDTFCLLELTLSCA